jgi:hypothetical protein
MCKYRMGETPNSCRKRCANREGERLKSFASAATVSGSASRSSIRRGASAILDAMVFQSSNALPRLLHRSSNSCSIKDLARLARDPPPVVSATAQVGHRRQWLKTV